MKKFFRRFLLFLGILCVVIVIALLILGPGTLPVLTGYTAKLQCSCRYVSGREEAVKRDEELNSLPYSLVSLEEDNINGMVKASIWGLAEQTAVYRPGWGCALVNDSEPAQILEKTLSAPVSADSLVDEWGISDSLSYKYNLTLLDSAVQAAFDPIGEKNTKNTRAIVVLHKGKLIAEHYAPGFDKETPQLGWSMTKSVISTLVGILVKQGKLRLDQVQIFEEWQNDGRNQISLLHLLQMTSGLEWNEFYFGDTDATKMLFKRDGAGIYALNRPLDKQPGEAWEYSSGTTNILCELLKRQLGGQDSLQLFARRELWDKVGMHSFMIETDANNCWVGSSFGYATPRDWARFGQLYLQNGVWEGQQLLPEDWVAFSTQPTTQSGGIYGAHFWLNRPQGTVAEFMAIDSLPEDTYMCRGHNGQRVFIIPSHELVVVRLGYTGMDDTLYMQGILKALK